MIAKSRSKSVLLAGSSRLATLIAALYCAGFSTARATEELALGAKLYKEQCASCHGQRGEGVKDSYANPLVGDRSVGQLAELIDRTMPEGEPEKLDAAQLRAVAAYIHDAFYSPVAQARNQPARMELARLTVRQYQNAIADLIGSYRTPVFLGKETGLAAEYFKNRRMEPKNRVIQRNDPQIAFDFGENSPAPLPKELETPVEQLAKQDPPKQPAAKPEYKPAQKPVLKPDASPEEKTAFEKNQREYDEREKVALDAYKPKLAEWEKANVEWQKLNTAWFEREKDRVDRERREKERLDAIRLHHLEFSVRWEGSFVPPETGEYEFVVRTPHAARLNVNDFKTPLIDAWVKSGSDTEYTASIRLLEGRVYRIRLEYSKSKQGVDDSKDKKKLPPPAKSSIALLWKIPGRTLEPIAQRFLHPEKAQPVCVVETPFPPDDRSMGYERGTTISKAWDNATTDAALEIADHVVANIRDIAYVPADSPEAPKKFREFALRFAERAFRRPLTEDQKKVYVERQFETTPDLKLAVKKVVILVLKSPRFLYREVGAEVEPGKLDHYAVAERLAFGMWDSLPDQKLLEAAAQKKLGTRDEIAKQADRMWADIRTQTKLRRFYLQWLRVDRVTDMAKDEKLYPEFDAAAIDDLRSSLELTIRDVVTDPNATHGELLSGGGIYLNGRLAKIYGAQLPADAPFTKVTLPGQDRAGVLSHPYILAGFAYTQTSSPIHRGVFIARSVLGRALRPPQEAFTPFAPDLHPGLTTRERVALQTKSEACQTCHDMINPLGFALERYDAIGRYRKMEKDRQVDATGGYVTRDDKTVKFAGAGELSRFLTASDEPRAAFVEQLFHNLIRQPIRAHGMQASAELRQSFAASGGNLKRLVVDVVTTHAAQLLESPAKASESNKTASLEGSR
ncbi:MAG: DUF1592 domain-containing protein [Pirellulales bacterium]